MAYLGNAPVVGDSTNSFRLLDDIASFTVTFDATDTSVVSISGDTLSFTNHRFVTGQKVTYTDGGGTAIGGLTDGTSYFIIKVDQNTIKLATNASNAASSTAIDLTSGAAGGSHTLNVKFDGVNTKFKATFNNGRKASISRAGQLSLSINGVVQQPQDSSSPSVGYGVEADSTIVFSTAPVATDVVFGTFIGEVAASFDIEDNTIDNFTGDGSTTIFNLSKEVPSSQDVLVTLDGVTQHPSDASTTRSYSVIDQALTFVSAPADGVAIQARHIGFAGATTSAVTGFYGRTGNVALTSTDDISVQNISGVGATFTSNVNIEGVLTYEDVTNVDSIGIVTARAGVLVGSGITLSKDGDIFATGITTSTTFVGNLTGDVTGTLQTAAQTNITSLGSLSSLVVTGGITATGGNIVMNDSSGSSANRIKLGTSQDLELFHNGTDSFIKDSGTGKLRLLTDSFRVSNAADSENMIAAEENGAVSLFYDNSTKFQTYTNGIQFFGNIKNETDGTNQGMFLGAANDFQFYHDGNRSAINNRTGDLRLLGAGNIILGRADSGNSTSYDEQYISCTSNGAVELYHDNSKKLQTESYGARMFNLSGECRLEIQGSEGNGAYLQLNADDGDDYADYWRVYGGTSGDFYIQNYAGGSWETNIKATGNGAVELYYDNGKRIETTTYGITVTGNSNNPTTDSWETNSSIITSGTYGGGIAMIDGSAGFVQSLDGSGANYYLRNATTTSTPETSIKAIANGAVELYHNGTKMFQTSSTGFTLVGNRAISLDAWQGRFDRLWSNFPSISISPDTGYGSQSEFRVHGIQGSQVGYGSGGDFSIDFRIDGNYQQGSDQRRKTNIEEITGALDTVKQLTGKKFNIINRSGELDPNKGTQKQFGLIAQECKDIIPEVVKFHPDEDTPNENGWASAYGLDYGQLTPLLINAVKELSAENTALKARLDAAGL